MLSICIHPSRPYYVSRPQTPRTPTPVNGRDRKSLSITLKIVIEIACFIIGYMIGYYLSITTPQQMFEFLGEEVNKNTLESGNIRIAEKTLADLRSLLAETIASIQAKKAERNRLNSIESLDAIGVTFGDTSKMRAEHNSIIHNSDEIWVSGYIGGRLDNSIHRMFEMIYDYLFFILLLFSSLLTIQDI